MSDRLPEREWKFDAVPDGEVSIAFFYEFSRSSSTVRARVEGYRREWGQADKIFRKHGTFPSPAIQAHHLADIICSLAALPDFPERPWMEVQNLGFDPKRILTPEESHKLAAFAYSPSPKALRVLNPSGSPVRQPPAAHEIDLRIDFRFSNDDIIEAVRRNLPQCRPHELTDRAQHRPSQQSWDGERLPFRKGPALNWLGTFRRRKVAKTWREFLEVYPRKKSQKVLPPATAADASTLARSFIADVRKAELILDWFANGTPLNPIDFK